MTSTFPHSRDLGLFCLLTIFLVAGGCGESTEPISEAEPTQSISGTNLEPPPEGTEQTSATEGTHVDQSFEPEASSGEEATGARLTEPSTSFRFELEGGSIEGRLSDQQAYETELPVPVIPEGTRELWLHVRSTRQKGTRLTVSLHADAIRGLNPLERHFRDYKLFIKGESWSPRIRLPEYGLRLGRYRLHLAIENGPSQDLFFEVISEIEPATRVTDELPPAGFNVAARALGGSIQSFSGQKNTANWRADNLIDGFAQIHGRLGTQLSSGWLTRMTVDEPPEVVLEFHEARTAQVQAVLFEPIHTGLEDSGIPRHIEILASDREDEAGFELIATTRLHNEYGWQWVRVGPVAARFLKVRVLNNYPGPQVALGEISVIESHDASASILADTEINLAAPALGGSLVWLSSQHPKFQAAQLFQLTHEDADPQRAEWRSADTKRQRADYLPQDFVFSFSADRTAFIDRVRLSPSSESARSDGTADERAFTSVSVSVSTSERAAGFEEVSRVEVQPGQPVDIPIRREARYLQIRLLENNGGAYTRLGDIQIVEGRRTGYQSIVWDRARQLAAGRDKSLQDFVKTRPDRNEPNDFSAQATPTVPGEMAEGNLHNLADIDYFRVSVAGSTDQTMTLSLRGTPSIRTSVQLENSSGEVLKRYVPQGDQGTAARFSWQVAPGEYLIGIDEPPLSLVVVWDTSGSMDGRMAALEKAVRQFLSGIEPGEKAQLVRFSDRQEVLLENFTSDRAAIEIAIEGKFSPNGSTALIDALSAAQNLLSDVDGRQAIVVFTDGLDTASRIDEGAFWAALRESTAQVFTVGLGSDLGNFSYRTGSTGHQFLNSLSTISGGKYFHARSEESLESIFHTIAADLRARPEYSMVAETSDQSGTLRVVSVGERIPGLSAPRFELILDASGSMKKKIADGRTRMEVARTVLKEIIEEIPDDVEVALRVFGHRIAEGQTGDCADTELLQPLERLDKASLLSRIDSVEALGTTLLAHTLEQLPDDLGQQDNDQFVVLVTDGEEECRDDLPQTVQRMKDDGLKMNLSIIGFAIDDEAISKQLEEVATIGGGVFVKAEAGGELKTALDQALAPAFEVRDANGDVLAWGTVNGSSLTLPSGVYDIAINGAAGELLASRIVVEPGGDAVLELDRQGSEIGITAR